MSIDRLWLLGAGSITALAYFAVRLVHHRSRYRDLPCPPHSMIWGHLKIIGEYVKKLPRGIHMQSVITELRADYDLPDVFYIDLWPLGPQFVFCNSPEASAIPTTENTFDMHPEVGNWLSGSVGARFIEATNGTLWKHLHQTLAPGLTPSIIRGNHGSIIEQAATLRRRFSDMAESGKVTDIRHELGYYPFQVMVKILLNETISAQIYDDVKNAIDLQGEINATNNPFAKWRINREAKRLWKRIEAAIEPKIRARFTALQQQDAAPTKSSVTCLLDRMMLSEVQSGQPLGYDIMRIMLDNVNGLLAAGYGTTSDASTYILMLLSVFPDALQKLREEHDRIFDKDHDKTVQMLQEQPGLINNLAYTTAVVNETLRLFTVGFSIRAAPSSMPTMEYKGRSYPLKDHLVSISQQTLHYNPKYFDEPTLFKPERFTSAEPSFPRNAYRPFEKGLRSCLGQPLAMDEMKILLVMVARWFDFELREHNPSDKPRYSHTDLDTKIGDHAIQSWAFTAGPAGKVMMKVTERR
ncbi:cytochrome P450 [Trichoderma sp. SZMC 28014]